MDSISERILASNQAALEWSKNMGKPKLPGETASEGQKRARVLFGAGILRIFLDHLGGVGTTVRVTGVKKPGAMPVVHARCSFLIDPKIQADHDDWDIENMEWDSQYNRRWCALKIRLCKTKNTLSIRVTPAENSPYGQDDISNMLQDRIKAVKSFLSHAFGEGPKDSMTVISPAPRKGGSGTTVH